MSDFEAVVNEREVQLRSGNAIALAGFWTRVVGNRQILFELAALEMEFAWKSPAASEHKLIKDVADFVRAFPDWNDPELIGWLLAEEYRVRRRFGDRPRREDFLAKALSSSPELENQLLAIDRQLREEFGSQVATRAVEHETPPVPAFDPRAPLSSADYLVQRFIGAGSLGRVYRAWQHSLQRAVAIKFLRKHFLRNATAIDRFISEARLAGGLRHPGIIAIHGLGRTPAGNYFIAMDFVDGKPLAPVRNRSELKLGELLDAIAQAAEAMTFAHATGVIHCDLKPANILLSREGRVTLTDFGLARQLVDEQSLLQRGEGTPVCIAPEQIDGCWGSLSPATDVFNLAATLYLLLTGRSPHSGTSAAEIFASAVSGAEIPPLGSLDPNIPNALDELLAAGLTKRVGERLASMREFATSLRAIIADDR